MITASLIIPVALVWFGLACTSAADCGCSLKRNLLENVVVGKEPTLGAIQENGSQTGILASANRMVFIPRGKHVLGSPLKPPYPQDMEYTSGSVDVDAFYIHETEVTLEQFSVFVKESGYITDADRFGWSFVFHLLLPEKLRREAKEVVMQTPWWFKVAGANFSHLDGESDYSSSHVHASHPVTHVSWNDANAFCKYYGLRLPSELEWEYAASGGLRRRLFPWGNKLNPNSTHKMNVWQGRFPDINTSEDGFISTAPAKWFQPNGFGLYNMCGNVWEWVDAFHDQRNITRVIKGGSFLCHQSYCYRYRISARMSNEADSSASNIGFRCATNQNI